MLLRFVFVTVFVAIVSVEWFFEVCLDGEFKCVDLVFIKSFEEVFFGEIVRAVDADNGGFRVGRVSAVLTDDINWFVVKKEFRVELVHGEDLSSGFHSTVL